MKIFLKLIGWLTLYFLACIAITMLYNIGNYFFVGSEFVLSDTILAGLFTGLLFAIVPLWIIAIVIFTKTE